MYFRRGAGGAYNNLLFYNWITQTVGRANIADSIQPNITSGDFSANGLLSWNNGFYTSPAAANTLDGQVTANFRTFFGAAARQMVIADPLLRRPLERSNPDLRPLTGPPAFRANWIPPTTASSINGPPGSAASAISIGLRNGPISLGNRISVRNIGRMNLPYS